MQERLQKQMAELRVEATAGGGMVTVVVNGAKQVQSLKIDPEVVVERRCRDAAGSDRRRRQRRPAQGRRGDGAEDGRHAAGRACKHSTGHRRLSCRLRIVTRFPMSLPIRSSAHRRAAAPARHRPEGRAAPRVPHPQDAARAGRSAGRRRARRQGARHLLLGLQQHHRRRSVRLLPRATTRDHHVICVVEEPQNVARDREDARVQGRLSRADGRAVAAAGHRSRRSEDQGPAGADRRRRRPK